MRGARKTTTQLSSSFRFRLDLLDDARGNATNDGQRGHVAGDDGARSHRSAVSARVAYARYFW